MDRLLGMNSPYSPEMTQLLGLDPAEMRRQAIFRGLQQAGVQLMNSGKLGDAFQGLSEGVNEAKDEYMQQQMLGYKMKTAEEDRAYQNEQREADRAKQEAYNQWVSTLPEHLRPAVMANPGLGVDYVQATDPAFQKANSSNQQLGLNGVPLTDGTGTFVGYGQFSNAGGLFFNGQPVDGVNIKPMDPQQSNYNKAIGTTEGKAVGAARGDLPGAVVQAEVTSMKIQSLMNDPNLDGAVGWASYAPDIVVPNSVISVRGKITELMGGAFLEARQMLKGGGQITDFEGQRAERAYTRMETAIKSSDPQEFKNALADFNQAVNEGVRKLAATARQPVPEMGGPQPIPAPDAANQDPLRLRGQ